MKKILTIALLLIAINAQGQGLPVPANATLASLFPDENLRAVVAEVLGPNAGLTGQRLSDALARIEVLNADNRGISDASGIEYLLGLTLLFMNTNQITIINLDNNINLTTLGIAYNLLTNINIGNLVNLIGLGIGGNPLTSLDVSNNIYLTHLSVFDTKLISLDISNIIDLTMLWVSETVLTEQNIIGFNDNIWLNPPNYSN